MASPADRTVGLVLLALVVVAAILAVPDPDVVSTDRRASSIRSSPSGVRGLYLTLEELGVPVGRRMSPWAGAEPVPRVMALLAPTEPASPREVGALVERIRAGGALLYVPRPNDVLLDTLGLELVTWFDVATDDGTSGLWEAVGVAQMGPWDLPGQDDVWSPRALEHPWTAGVEEPGGFRRAFVAPGGEPDVRPLIADDTLLFVVEASLGAGRVVALSDPLPLTNEWVRVADVAPVVVRAAAELTAAGDTLVFDEYHHGFRGGSIREGVAAFLTGRPLGHVLLQAAAVLLLALGAAGVRFGAPRPGPAPRRSPLEHVDALARAYQESGARRLPRLLLLSGLARHAHRPHPHDEAEAGELLAGLRGGTPGAREALDRLEGALRGDDDDLLGVSTAVDRVTGELRR